MAACETPWGPDCQSGTEVAGNTNVTKAQAEPCTQALTLGSSGGMVIQGVLEAYGEQTEVCHSGVKGWRTSPLFLSGALLPCNPAGRWRHLSWVGPAPGSQI